MPFCGLPKDVRELVRFASDAMNAHQRGLSIPTVALHYRFEPGQAESFLRKAIQEYGPENVRPHCTRYIFSLFWPPTEQRAAATDHAPAALPLGRQLRQPHHKSSYPPRNDPKKQSI